MHIKIKMSERAFEDLTSIVGTVVFTCKSLYWVAGIGYIFVAVFSFIAAYTLPETTDFSDNQLDCLSRKNDLRPLSQWVLYTNLIALVSFLCFYYGEKGMGISVIGSIAFALNLLQMIVLFIYAQVKVFNSNIGSCRQAAVDKNTGFVR